MARSVGTTTVRVRFVENVVGERGILQSRRLYDKLNEDQREAVALAKAAVPRRSGALQDGIVGEVIETPNGPRARIRSKDWKSLWFENGSSKVRARHHLRGALEKLGYVVRSTRSDVGQAVETGDGSE